LFLVPIFNLTVGISVADDVTQVMIIPISPSAVFLRVESNYWLSPTWTLSVVKILTSHIAATIRN
jgi:hypothetical protein